MTAAGFSVERARRALPPFDLDVRAPLRGELASYAALYGLDRLAGEVTGGADHFLGSVEAFGYQIATQVWLPRRPPRGTLLVLHGYFDHVGLFTHAIRRGLQRGYAVVAYDLPGHGLSSGNSGDIADFIHYQEVLKDLLAVLKPRLPGPWVAVGQSTGGAILLDHITTALAVGRKPAFQRVQLWAPLVRVARWRQVTLSHTLLGRLLKQVPRHFRSSSSDPAFIDFLWNRDPFQIKHVPMHWVDSMLRWTQTMLARPACRFPVTVVQGDLDETVDWRFNVDYVQRHTFVEKLVMVAGASHHLANERDDLREQVMAALDRYVLT